MWQYQVGQLTNTVAVTVEVASGDQRMPPVCTSMTGNDPCDEIRRLPDGSTAYRKSYPAGGGQSHEVRIERPDGTRIFVSSSAEMPPGSAHDSPLDADRVLEIATAVTVTP